MPPVGVPGQWVYAPEPTPQAPATRPKAAAWYAAQQAQSQPPPNDGQVVGPLVHLVGQPPARVPVTLNDMPQAAGGSRAPRAGQQIVPLDQVDVPAQGAALGMTHADIIGLLLGTPLGSALKGPTTEAEFNECLEHPWIYKKA